MTKKRLVWFRNDLRTGDHHALYHACKGSAGEGVLAVAVITPKQWALQDEAKSKIQFWLANLEKLRDDLSVLNIPLIVLRVPTNREVPAALFDLASKFSIASLYFNREYPEYEQRRDALVIDRFSQASIPCLTFDSDIVFPVGSILTKQGLPFKVFTPFCRAWKEQFSELLPHSLPVPNKQVLLDISASTIPKEFIYAVDTGAQWTETLWPAGTEEAYRRLYRFIHSDLNTYPTQRDFPGLPATSSLSPYLSCGVISVQQCLDAIQTYSDDPEWLQHQWVTELVWREFYRHLLVHFPHMNRWQPFKGEVEARLSWEPNESLFDAWCQGETGFAIVDAGMKQLKETGWMHNRVRMITASFLTKLLRQDWRRGARYFMQHLIDGDFASNMGGWQWSASVGADAAPYFRIFNPMRQAERFDPEGAYVGEWIPSLVNCNSLQQHDPLLSTSLNRPRPIIDYALERKYSLDAYNAK